MTKLIVALGNFAYAPKKDTFIVCFLLGNSPASEFYMPTFRNTLFHLHRRIGVGVGVGCYPPLPAL